MKMMSRPAISIDGLGKQYQIGLREERHLTFREAIVQAAQAPIDRFRRLVGRVDERSTFWALRSISFEVQPGEVVGIIGRNGAGKSTLLKILSRITEPTEGNAAIRGRVGSLLEVGTGFHNELTGRENVYLNGSILGMTRREIDRKFDEIVEFSGVEQFIDTPVKHYSSGMKVRLGFAVAAHLEPEILIVDEVLAVGDFEFQKKCLGKMNDVASSGRTVLFVSHNTAAVESLCTRAVLLDRGRLVEDGDAASVLRAYLRTSSVLECASRDLSAHPDRAAQTEWMMRKVVLRNEDGVETTSFPMSGALSIEVDFATKIRFSPVLGVVIKTELGTPVFGVDNRMVPGFTFDELAGEGTIACRLDNLPLTPGGYSLDLYLGNRSSSLDCVRDAIRFQVVAADIFGTGKLPHPSCGPVCWPGRWQLTGARKETQEAVVD
jgi:lipopolysaccharide transport system ATP-binding protein